MFYKFNLFFLLLFSLNGLIEAQEYSITSDKIEINTDIDRIIYEDNVSFESENVTFKADKLIVIESTDEFYATGNPIKISFFDGYEFIEGEAAKVEIKNDDLILSESVSIIKSGNKIKSESFTNALAKAVLCCCPPDNSSGFLFNIADNFKSSATFPTLCLISSFLTPVIASGEAIFS